MPGRVIYIVRSWPRLSQTFVVNEVIGLERRGVEVAIFSLVRSREPIVQPRVDEVRAPVRYLEDQLAQPWIRRVRLHLRVLAADPARYLRVMTYCLRHPGLASGYGSSSTMQSFSHALRITAGLETMRAAGRQPDRVHAHFAHDPALVGMLVGRLTGLPFSFTAHARDLLQIPPASLAARAEAATALVTCCEANLSYIRTAVPAAVRPPVVVLHHGVELDRFVPTPRDPDVPVPKLVSVGRLVEKKGYADLLRALVTVQSAGVAFGCDIYGDGPLGERLRTLRDELGLHDRVRFMGARSNDQIQRALGGADVFVLTPRATPDGDRDGIPNVLVEAMACGLPTVTTSSGGITELVRHGRTGLVCGPGDLPSIAASVSRLLVDPALRAALGAAGRKRVEVDFDVETAAREMERVLLPTPTRSGVSR